MKVYVVVNEWQTPAENSTDYLGVYDSVEKAQVVVNKSYEEDLQWIKDRGYKLDDLEINIIAPDKSDIVTKDCDYWSYNFIIEQTVL